MKSDNELNKYQANQPEKIFQVEVKVRGDRLGTGTAARKKDAEQIAAEAALLALQEKGIEF